MFYKRISDLHPLGKPTNGNWKNIEPIPFSRGTYYDVEPQDGTYSYRKTTNQRNEPANTGYAALDAIFNSSSGKKWYNDTLYNKDYTYVEGTERSGTAEERETEYFAKSLWFEVAVGKNDNGVPTSYNPTHYQSKRVNAYLLFTNIDTIIADKIEAPLVSAMTLNCTDINATRISANKVDVTSITANYADINSINVSSITAQAISSDLGIIENLHGDMLYYDSAYFSNITVVSTANLTAEAAYWADLAEMYTADSDYRFGTLVKFGGEKEITIADDKANAVISEKPAITMNSQNTNENALPIVLTGRSKVRTIHEIKKFDKIYLSETPGVGTSEKYKIPTSTTPIGIALENKPYDEEGLVECILQLNFE